MLPGCAIRATDIGLLFNIERCYLEIRPKSRGVRRVVDEEKHGRIKQALSLRGTSLSDIARAQGVKPSTVSLVSTGWRRSQRLELAIANALDLTPDEIWPDRYS